jgi:hypothetical protein
VVEYGLEKSEDSRGRQQRIQTLQNSSKQNIHTVKTMSYRLHVAKKYEVEYALGDAFNYKCSEFHNLLSACGAEYTGEEWDADFEVQKDDWKKVIDKLKHLHDLPDDEQEEIRGAVDDLGSNVDEVISMLEYYLEHSDPNNDVLNLSFF